MTLLENEHKRPSPKPDLEELIQRGGATSPKGAQTFTIATGNEEGASLPNAIFNLVKSIVGSGVLGLPSGIAAFGTSAGALVPGIFLVFFIGGMSAYGFSLVGRVCSYTQSRSYREAWANSVGQGSSWLPAACCMCVTFCSVLGYSMILADTIPQLLETVGVASLTRTQALVGTTVFVLLPLCFRKKLKSLAPFSVVGIAGMLYTCVAMATRYLDGSYAEGGALLETLQESTRPHFEDPTGASPFFDPNLFVLMSMLSTAAMAHYNAPKFLRELRNNTLDRFGFVVISSFTISLVLFAVVASLGFLTFGESCSGLILNNYSTQDELMSLSRVAVTISITCSCVPLLYLLVLMLRSVSKALLFCLSHV